MSDTVIRVENLGKKYTIGHQQEKQQYTALRDVIANGAKGLAGRFRGGKGQQKDLASEDFWALKDVSFEIKQGDRVGIIGRNGAGKSTLLKILSRITEPTMGRVSVRGRIASLLEVGTGFHPELTGRENIFLNGAILGMSRVEIHQKFDEIVAFSETEKFLDTPVKRYSSGMYVRLAFSVAAHLEPEILIVDEVLAVGDATFQKKCLGKMEDAGREGRTVLFVSHNMNALSSLCKSAIMLESGEVRSCGEVTSIISEYLTSYSAHKDDKDISRYRCSNKSEGIYFTNIEMSHNKNQVQLKENIEFSLSIVANRAFDFISVGGTIFNSLGNPVGAFVSKDFSMTEGASVVFEAKISGLVLSPGTYYAGFSIGKGNFMNTSRCDYEVVIGLPSFEILPFNEQEEIGLWNPTWGNIVLNDYLIDDVVSNADSTSTMYAAFEGIQKE